jgi:hypothetical protein
LLHLDISLGDDLLPVRDLIADETAEFVGRAARGLGAYLRERFLEGRLLQRLVDRSIQPSDGLLRRAAFERPKVFRFDDIEQRFLISRALGVPIGILNAGKRGSPALHGRSAAPSGSQTHIPRPASGSSVPDRSTGDLWRIMRC